MKKFIILLAAVISLNPLLISTTHAETTTQPPSIISEAAIVIDSKTGDVLYENNAHTKMYPASLTKIATAIYAIETGDLDDIVTVSEKARNIEGTRVYLEEGERVTLKKLIQGLLINSGNDAGVAIAEHLSGSVKQFAFDINDYLKNVIGVEKTHFENPHGLFDPNHVTTAEDLAKITKYALQNDLFREIFGTVKLEWHGESWDTTLITHHKLLHQGSYEGITGGKTGFVNQSGFTLATTAKRDDLGLIVITLNTNFQSEAYKDTTNLLDYAFKNFERTSIAKGTTFKSGDQTYQTTEYLTYTHLNNKPVTKEMNADGTLDVISQSGSVINSFSLAKVEKKKGNDAKTVSHEVKTNSFIGDHQVMLIASTIIFLGLAGLYFRRHRIKKYN
ncbi:D-alanyl-D-alanine carboxypeptidase family protein [Virgibacillus doumboii]|uniref:D-alanyl-D-alanine carboxypeptidase family protein n=1 Tax=Virgibacillus doumboii TaxID=2697503 RepID=UPI0013DF21B9|nr:D-alanyl-D-alanine carboxypeptidase family protein [Virgibacillus doumboii]